MIKNKYKKAVIRIKITITSMIGDGVGDGIKAMVTQ